MSTPTGAPSSSPLRSPSAACRPMLRLGLVVGRRLVQERLVPLDCDVRIGVAPRSTLSLPDHALPPGLPPSLLLLRGGGTVPVLVVSSAMRGRIERRGRRLSLEGLGGSEPAVLPLDAADRVCVRIGDCTVLVQTVQVARTPALPLPGRFRPRLLDQDDPVFIGILSSVSAVAAAAMLWVFSVGPVESVTLADLPREVERIVLAAHVPVEPAPEVELLPEPLPTPEPEAVAELPADDPSPLPVAASAQEQAENEALGRARARAEVTHRAAVLDLFAKGGATDAVFGSRTGLDELQGALAGADGPARAGTTGSSRGPSGGGRGQDDTIGGPERGRVRTAVVSDGAHEAAPRPKVLGSPVLPPSADDAARLRTALHPVYARIQRCYEQQLTRDPSIAGRIVLSMELVNGRVAEALIVEDAVGSGELADCIVKRARALRTDPGISGDLELPLVFSAGG